jgi:hypothetical protein
MAGALHAVGGVLPTAVAGGRRSAEGGHIPPAEIFEQEKVFDLGGVRDCLIWLGPGHTRGDQTEIVACGKG